MRALYGRSLYIIKVRMREFYSLIFPETVKLRLRHMLKRTFIHIPGIGPKREIMIWQAGVKNWEEFLEKGPSLLPRGIFNLGRRIIEQSLEALERPDGINWLAAAIPKKEHWRFYPCFDRVVYLDIESGGDPEEWGGVTVVGLYDGREVEQYVADHNMWLVDRSMEAYSVVVTFAGQSFDLPVLKENFANIKLPPVHIDLKWTLNQLGMKGGLKRLEKRLGLKRPPEVEGLCGWDAVKLWRRHQAGEAGALDLLLAYNSWDVINLKPLLEYSCRELAQRLQGRVIPKSGLFW